MLPRARVVTGGSAWFGAAFVVTLVVAACSAAGSRSGDGSADGDAGGGIVGGVDGAVPEDDSAARDAATHEDGSSSTRDGAAQGTCTSIFDGTALTGAFGRMDGYLDAIVPTNGPHSCRADSGHVHLQVRVNGVLYDVAVNTDTYVAAKDIAMPDGAWSEGWHSGMHLDYPTTLGLHAADFAVTTPSAQQQTVETALAGANQVSIFATPYDPTGAHDVHRRGGGYDGAIFVDAASTPAHLLAFRFSTDSF